MQHTSFKRKNNSLFKMNKEKIEFILIQVLIWVICLAAMYVGFGGLGNEHYNNKLTALITSGPAIGDTIKVEAGSLKFKNEFEMKKYEIIKQQEKFMHFIPWMKNLPELIIHLLTCCSFSLLGSYILITRSLILNKQKVSIAKIPAITLSSFLTGLVVMGLSYLLPTVLINEGGKIRPDTLMFLSLFGGIFSNTLYKKLSKYADELFKTT